ncbi:DUF5691 domain-containing protein [Nocardioides zeae]
MSSRSATDAWADGVVAAAILGSGRRAAPELPEALGGPGPAADSGTRLLDAATVLAAVRSVGAPDDAPMDPAPILEPGPAPAPADTLAPPPPRARQLLELLHATPAPVPVAERDLLVRHWLERAAACEVRVPHDLLPTLLERARATPALRPPLRPVLDARGRWLAAQHPGWSAVLADDRAASAPTDGSAARPDPAAWPHLSAPARLALLLDLRASDAAAERAAAAELVASTWAHDPVGERADHLEALGATLAETDEPLLERALDDRSVRVRGLAQRLLDGLPTSRRARRMAERLAPLLSRSGILGRRLDVATPPDPDDAGVRDGLTPPPRGTSRHDWWLATLVAGAPLAVLTTASGVDEAATYQRLPDPLRDAVRRAALLRRDVDWARAVIAVEGRPSGLLPVLPPAERTQHLGSGLARCRGASDLRDLRDLLAALPVPTDPGVAREAVEALHRVPPARLVLPPDTVHHLRDALVDAPPTVLARLTDLVRTDLPETTGRTLSTALQLLSLRRSISEALR